MSRLLVVRHAQASFLADDYDNLSDLGRRQACLLAEHWLNQGIRVDACYVGPRRRHRDTAQLVAQYYQDHGMPWPEAQIAPAWDEHQVDAWILRLGQLRPTLPLSHQIAPLLTAWHQATEIADREKSFQRLFEAMTLKWVEGQWDNPGIESYLAFHQRVRGACDRFCQSLPRGQRIALFTSVGPVSLLFQKATGCDHIVAMQTGWRLRNTSLTEFEFTSERFTLDTFNQLPHLPVNMWTYR